VIAYLGILVQQYERARSLLRAQEQSADRSHFALDSARKTIAWTDREIATTRAHTAETRAKSAQRVREREVLRSGLDATRTRVADAGARLGLTETAVFIIGLHQREVAECLDGIRGATDAIGSGDDAAAVASLRAAAPSCSTALIAATGTRFPFDFPDPSVIRVGGTYYGYSTNSGVGDIQVIPLNLYVFYNNPFNYVAILIAGALSLFFRFSFQLYGKSNKIFTKKIAAVSRKKPGSRFRTM